MIRYSWLFITTILFLSLSACENNDDSEVVDFSGILLFDINGQAIGCHGMPCDDDWERAEFSEKENALFNNLDNTIDLGELNPTGSAELVSGWPMPIARDGNFFFGVKSDSAMLFQAVAVDKNLDVYNTFSTVISSDRFSNLVVNETWFDPIPSKTTTRMYFRIINGSAEAVFQGYADIAICPEGVGGADYLECLP